MKKYDYIIAGAGCAGLSLLARLVTLPSFGDMKILVLDKSPKLANDRTWCFWERADDPGFFDPLVHKSWDNLYILSRDVVDRRRIAPYSYKLIRSRDLYSWVFAEIDRHPNIDISYGAIESVKNDGEQAVVLQEGTRFVGSYVFSSLISDKMNNKRRGHYLDQRFKGWWIWSKEDVFDESTATLMDFRVPQDGCTSFVYMLPVSPRRALVEYTQFTDSTATNSDYDSRLQLYMRTFYSNLDFVVETEESGNIPMTNHRFPSQDGRIIYVGTAGGQTKPSTGYTFQFIQSHSDRLVDAIRETGSPAISNSVPGRFQFYDSVLLRVLLEGKVEGRKIFTTLFRENDISDIFRFLDNSTRLQDELRILSSLPKRLFTKAAFRELLHAPVTK